LLVCFEGIDGAGKSSLIKLFRDYLYNQNIYNKYLHFPNDQSYYGKIIYDKLNGRREIPDDIFQSLYVLDFYYNQDIINYMLKTTDIVILDRYYYSTLAYSNYYGNIFAIAGIIGQLIEPQITFYLKIPAEIAISRLQNIDKKDKHESNIELLNKTLEGYDLFDKNFIVLDGTKSVEENLEIVIKEWKIKLI
jgi:dTMP kinase